MQYVKFKHYEPANARNMIGYLDRFVKQPIKEPLDVMRLFSPLTGGQRHHLNAMRAWFKCLEIDRPNGQFKEFVDSLRKAIPKDEVGIDIKVPEEEQIISDLKRIVSEPLPLQAEYNLLLESGLRLVEVIRFLNNFQEAEHLEGFYRCPVGFFRGSKQAYYCYMTEHTCQLIKKLNEKVSESRLKRRHQLHKHTRAKYLRKFANCLAAAENI